jgi:hypothetical protein
VDQRTRIIRPIRPSDVAKAQLNLIPDSVIESFNESIAEHFRGGISTFRETEVVARMIGKGLKRKDIYDKGWLNVSAIFNRWVVEHDVPGFNESYESTFTFQAKT